MTIQSDGSRQNTDSESEGGAYMGQEEPWGWICKMYSTDTFPFQSPQALAGGHEVNSRICCTWKEEGAQNLGKT